MSINNSLINEIPEEKSPQEDNQVATAQKLFGSDIVKVEDN